MCEFPRFYTAIGHLQKEIVPDLKSIGHPVLSRNDLTKLARALTKDSRAKHSRYLNWSRSFLSKVRYMAGRQCVKKLWQTVYDPEPAKKRSLGAS